MKGFKTVSLFLLALSVLCLSLVLQGCNSSSSSSAPTGHSELLFVSDGPTLKTVSASSGATLGSATISGVTGTYERTGSAVSVTMAQHWLSTGDWVELVFSPGTGGTATSGQYKITKVDANTFTVNDSASGTITGGTVLRKFTTTISGTYSQVATLVTISSAGHHLSKGALVKLDYTTGVATAATTTIANVINVDEFTVNAADSMSTSGNVNITIGNNYTIFGIAMHPSGKWVYTSSLYESYWGSGLISRFAVDWTTGALTFEKAIYLQALDLTSSAPVTISFSPDGNYLFEQNDDLDGLRMWSVNPADGSLTPIATSNRYDAYLHGVFVSSDGTRVYNGDTVFSATTSSITRVKAGGGGNSTVIVNNTLYSVDDNSDWAIKTFSLSDPDAPVLITSVTTTTSNEARDIAVSADGTRIVSAGWGGLKSYAYDGVSITPAVGAGSTQYIDGGGAWPTGGIRKMFRSVSMNNAGNLVASSYVTMKPASSFSMVPSGVMLFNLAADGSLSPAADYSSTTNSRVARFFKKP